MAIRGAPAKGVGGFIVRGFESLLLRHFKQRRDQMKSIIHELEQHCRSLNLEDFFYTYRFYFFSDLIHHYSSALLKTTLTVFSSSKNNDYKIDAFVRLLEAEKGKISSNRVNKNE